MSDETATSDFRMHELRGIDWGEMGGSRTASGIRVNADTSMACSAYTACIRVISDSVSSLPLHLYERLPSGGKRKASENPIYRLLHQQPNPWQTAQEFRDWMTGLYLHYGASYAEIRAGARGAVSELWPLHSSRMEVERVENGRLRYIYREPDGRVTTYRQEQIFALRFTTDDGIHPIPTYRLFQNAIGLSQALEAHGASYFGNGARPGIVLESDNPVPVEAAERLRESWERMHRGPDRAHRTAVLPAGVKAHELSQSNEAAQFLETRQYQVIEICRAFRVPPHMIQDLTRSTYSNIEVQGTEFVQHCLLPHLKRWEAAISRDLIDDERYFAEHNATGLLRGDHASRAQFYVSAIQNGWMSINEVREAENMNPLGPEGDKHFIQLNMTTLDAVGEGSSDASEPVGGTAEDDAEDLATSNTESVDMQAATDLQQQALNGAQVSSLLEIIANLSSGLLTAEGAKALIQGAFPTMPEATVDSIIAGVNEGVMPVQTQPTGGNSNGN
jgi:HK97 family phage portal protein